MSQSTWNHLLVTKRYQDRAWASTSDKGTEQQTQKSRLGVCRTARTDTHESYLVACDASTWYVADRCQCSPQISLDLGTVDSTTVRSGRPALRRRRCCE